MSVFDIVTQPSELSSVNMGLTNAKLLEITSTRPCTKDQFANGAINFRWQCSASEYWLPKYSYMRMNITLTDNNDAKLPATHTTNRNLIASLFTSADFKINGTTVCKTNSFLPQVDTLDKRLSMSESQIENNTAETLADFQIREGETDGSGLLTYDVIWKPSLPIFKVPHGIPCGEFELTLNPQPSSIYKYCAVESRNNTALVVETAYKFEVNEFQLMSYQVEGPQFQGDYYLDLNNIRCQSTSMSDNSSTSTFHVHPNTRALSIAFQDSRVNTASTMHSNTRFVILPATPNPATNAVSTHTAFKFRPESKIERLQLQFAGNNYPNNELRMTQDSYQRAYTDYALQVGSYYESGGAESYEHWSREFGPVLCYQISRDGNDKSTLVRVNITTSGIGADLANSNMLLFDHYPSVAKVSVRDGRTVLVQSYDM